MPLYEYVCEQCQQSIEVIQKFADAPLTTCEACGGTLFKPPQRTAFHLKGGGWYADGYGSSKKESGGTASSEGGSESKPKESTATPAAAASDSAKTPSGSDHKK